MDLSHLTPEENKVLSDFSTLFETEKYDEALNLVKEAVEKFPTSAYIWHNQIGALIYSIDADYVGASKHYYLALEKGFDKEICEDNIWESAEDLFNSLKTPEGSFNAILYKTDDGAFHSTRANHLLLQYVEAFPTGRFIKQAQGLLDEFEEEATLD